MAITAKQRRFVEEYLIDLNATQAAIRAGYSKRTAEQQGHQLLKKTSVQDELKKARQELSRAAGVDANWVLERLKGVAERCLQAAPVLDRKGNPVLIETPDGDMAPAYTFQAMGANRALELLGKHIGMFVDRHEHTGKDGQPLMPTVVRLPTPIESVDEWLENHKPKSKAQT